MIKISKEKLKEILQQENIKNLQYKIDNPNFAHAHDVETGEIYQALDFGTFTTTEEFLEVAEEVMAEKLAEKSQLPTQPTSGSWVKDAQALLEMGCRSIDANTVRGLLAKIKEQDESIERAFQLVEQALATADADEKALKELLILQELAEPDPWMEEPLTEEEIDLINNIIEKEEGS